MRLSRYAWIALAALFLALGVVGMAVPLLPTTPFVLLAAACAARGSQRLHRWMLAHRVFGPVIADWERTGAVSRRAKRVAVGTRAASAAIAWLVAPQAWTAALATAVMAVVAAWLWRRPEPSPPAAGTSIAPSDPPAGAASPAPSKEHET